MDEIDSNHKILPSEYNVPPKSLRERVYRLSPKDMDSVIELVSEIVDERTAEIDRLEKKLISEGSESVNDILDDLRPHNFWKHSFFWESCIWRLQGIFEGILDERFLNRSRKYKGLWDRISELKKSEYTILWENELLAWANFRNELSHSPPKQLDGHGALFGKAEVVAFRNFLVEILRNLEKQKTSKQVQTPIA